MAKCTITCLLTILALPHVFGQEDQQGNISTLVERGSHHNGMRVGVWEYYDHPSQLSLKVDYDKGKLLYVRPDTGQYYVMENDQWTRKRLAVPCRFGGSITSLIDYYAQFVVPVELAKQRKYFQTWLTFQVGPGGASNPQVIEDPGYGVREQLLELFNNAPNSWITGVDAEGKVQICLMAIRFDFCESCQDTSIPAKTLFTGLNPRPSGPRGAPNSIVSFSPDNSKVAFLPLTPGKSGEAERCIILDLKTKESRPLPFDHLGSLWWLDNDQVLFMPRYYSRVPAVLAKLSLSESRVTVLSDSVTSAHLLSPDRRKLAYLSRRKGGWLLSCTDLMSGDRKTILETSTAITPERWSPDGTQIVVSQRDGEFTRYLLVQVETGERRPLPVLNARICGWSSDGRFLYQVKNSSDEYRGSTEIERPTGYTGIVSVRTIKTTKYTSVTELFATDLVANSPQSILKKGKYIRVEHTGATDKFILQMDDDIYLRDTQEDSKPQKIIEKSRFAVMSSDGQYIAYISQRDNQLHLYTVATQQSKYLTLPVAEGSKKK